MGYVRAREMFSCFGVGARLVLYSDRAVPIYNGQVRIHEAQRGLAA